jgi:hypothetical protein
MNGEEEKEPKQTNKQTNKQTIINQTNISPASTLKRNYTPVFKRPTESTTADCLFFRSRRRHSKGDTLKRACLYLAAFFLLLLIGMVVDDIGEMAIT